MEGIQEEKVIVSEGDDDKHFITKFLEHEAIEEVQVISLGGESKIKKNFPLFFTRGNFDIIRKLAIVRDADSNSDAKFRSTVDIVENNGLAPPVSINTFSNENPSIGVFIITKPGCNCGMLEDLCLETVKDTEEMKCVNKLFECVDKLDIILNNPSKSKCQAYRATLPISYPYIGIGALHGIWAYEHEILDDLRNFLLFLKD